MKHLISRFLIYSFNFLFPKGKCRLCDRNVNIGLNEICYYCLKKIKKQKEPICNLCGSSIDINENLCFDCTKEKPPFEYHRTIYIYDGPIKTLLFLYKSDKRYQLAKIFGLRIARLIRKAFLNTDFDLITFIPSPFLRRISRGFCPAELIALEIGKRLRVPVKELLKINKNLKEQKRLSFKERIENIKGAFISKCDLKDKKVILIDDLYTTGSTIKEASRELKKSGASVYAFTFAIRERKSFDFISPIND